MVVKLLSPTEIKATKESELTRDLARTKGIKDALAKVTQQLNEANDKFELALANQQRRWAKEESDAILRLEGLNKEISLAETRLTELRLPIEEEKKKAHDLLKSAEATYLEAQAKLKAVEESGESNARQAELLQEKLDMLSEREETIRRAEDQLEVMRIAIADERNHIKKLSQELSIKLSTF